MSRTSSTITKPQASAALDLSFVEARPVVTRAWRNLEIVLVGCGGTGSWLAPSLARLVKVLREDGKWANLTFVDPDIVERKNVPRQNFCAAEIGVSKAETLAYRYGTAWGLEIGAVTDKFGAKYVPALRLSGDGLLVLVGCVDNAQGRASLQTELHRLNHSIEPHERAHNAWWLDCGNAQEGGQVLLGSAPSPAELRGAFEPSTLCRALPSPALQRPELLEALPDEPGAGGAGGAGGAEDEPAERAISCAELTILNAQSLMINQNIAAVAADYLLRLVMTGDLRKFATFVDLPTGASKSYYTTPEAVSRSIKAAPSIFDVKPPQVKRLQQHGPRATQPATQLVQIEERG